MNRFFPLLAALMLAASVPVAQAQAAIDFCFVVDQNDFTMEGTMYNDTDVALVTDTDVGVATEYLGTAVRGTISAEIRHHSFLFINPEAEADPGCSGAGGLVDWLYYNGRITGGNASSGYIWDGTFENSCETGPASRSGVIYIGSCPAPRQAPVAPEFRDELAPGASDALGD